MLHGTAELHSWLEQLAGLFSELAPSPDLHGEDWRAAWDRAAAVLITTVVERSNGGESWYDHCACVLRWFVEDSRLPVADPRELVLEAINGKFGSWTAPPEMTLRYVAGRMAELMEPFDGVAPAPDTPAERGDLPPMYPAWRDSYGLVHLLDWASMDPAAHPFHSARLARVVGEALPDRLQTVNAATGRVVLHWLDPVNKALVAAYGPWAEHWGNEERYLARALFSWIPREPDPQGIPSLVREGVVGLRRRLEGLAVRFGELAPDSSAGSAARRAGWAGAATALVTEVYQGSRLHGGRAEQTACVLRWLLESSGASVDDPADLVLEALHLRLNDDRPDPRIVRRIAEDFAEFVTLYESAND